MSKFKGKIPVREIIFDVWVGNKNGYLTASQIAERGFGEAYTAHTYRELESKVKRSIYPAMAIAAERGFVVIGEKNPKLKDNPYDRWKIAGEEDKQDLMIVLDQKANKVNGYINARKTFIDNAAKNNLIENSETLKQIIS